MTLPSHFLGDLSLARLLLKITLLLSGTEQTRSRSAVERVMTSRLTAQNGYRP